MRKKINQASVQSGGVGFVVRLRRTMSPETYQKRLTAEIARLRRHYSGVFALWRSCRHPPCRRARRCAGDASVCLRRAVDGVPRPQQIAARERLLAATPANIGAPERLARGFLPSGLFE